MTKQEALNRLATEMAADEGLPLCQSNLVFGEGKSEAEVIFVGEAPGQREDELKRPFVGRAGQLLDKLMGEIGWRREDVYITNIVKRRPPENRDPLPEEIDAYSPSLARQIEIIRPKVIVPLGRFSMNYFLPAAKITRDQGQLFRHKNYFVYPLFHPAAALRSTTVLGLLRQAFKRLPEAILKAAEIDAGPEKVVEQTPSIGKQTSLF